MPELVRTLRLRDLVLLIIGSVIGSGIFLVPAGILNQVDHSVAAAALVWITGGILCLLGALTYGELAAMKPEAGGLYVYIRDSFGRLPAFLYGWSLFLAIATGSVSALAVAFSTYLGAVIPLAPWTAKHSGKTLMQMPKAGLVRGLLMNHGYHHRGQLSVYLRLLDIPVPSIYGPTADENPFA